MVAGAMARTQGRTDEHGKATPFGANIRGMGSNLRRRTGGLSLLCKPDFYLPRTKSVKHFRGLRLRDAAFVSALCLGQIFEGTTPLRQFAPWCGDDLQVAVRVCEQFHYRLVLINNLALADQSELIFQMNIAPILQSQLHSRHQGAPTHVDLNLMSLKDYLRGRRAPKLLRATRDRGTPGSLHGGMLSGIS